MKKENDNRKDYVSPSFLIEEINYLKGQLQTKTDQEKSLLEQITNLTSLIRDLRSTPSSDGNKVIKSKIGRINFTKKEMEKMPRLKDFSIRYREKADYYEIRYRRYGYNKTFTGKTLQKAKIKAFDWLRTFEYEIAAKDRFSVFQKEYESGNINQNNVNFKVFADNYIFNIKKKRVKESTFVSYKYNYTNHILPYFKKYRLSEIKSFMIQPVLDELHENKPRACEDVKTLLSGIFEYAVNCGFIQLNPMKVIYVPKHQRETGKALTIDEEKELIRKLENHRFKYHYLKMLYSGIRPCEINDLKEDNEQHVIIVKNGKLKEYQKNLTRTIPVFPMYETCFGIDCEKVTRDLLNTEFRKIVPNHTIKDLRHTFTTRARECGIDNELVSIWTGHSLGNITASVYTHFSLDFQKEKAKQLIYNY